jgi:hypothetical protein
MKMLFFAVIISSSLLMSNSISLPLFNLGAVKASSEISILNNVVNIEVDKKIFQRIPKAVWSTTKISLQSFTSNCALMIPLCLFIGLFHKHPSAKIWFKKSLIAGAEWGVISAAYSGGEEFLKILRNKDDIWNRSFASGLASSFFQYKTDGTSGLAMGFITGFGLVYMLERFIPGISPDITDISVEPAVIKNPSKAIVTQPLISSK